MSADKTFTSEVADIVSRQINGTLDEATATSLSREAARRYLAAWQADQQSQAAQQAEAARIAAQPLRERLGATALACGARPNTVRMVIREGEEIFELKDGQLLPRDGRRHPHDPLVPLDVITWLATLRETDDYLFHPLSVQ
jgi:hypothetical protein